MPHLIKKYMPDDKHKSYAYYECSECKAVNDWNAWKCQGCHKAITGTDTSVDRVEEHPSSGPGDDDWMGELRETEQ